MICSREVWRDEGGTDDIGRAARTIRASWESAFHCTRRPPWRPHPPSGSALQRCRSWILKTDRSSKGHISPRRRSPSSSGSIRRIGWLRRGRVDMPGYGSRRAEEVLGHRVGFGFPSACLNRWCAFAPRCGYGQLVPCCLTFCFVRGTLINRSDQFTDPGSAR